MKLAGNEQNKPPDMRVLQICEKFVHKLAVMKICAETDFFR